MGTEKIRYTCSEYRAEMILLMLHRRLSEKNLSPEDKAVVKEKIDALQAEMGLD